MQEASSMSNNKYLFKTDSISDVSKSVVIETDVRGPPVKRWPASTRFYWTIASGFHDEKVEHSSMHHEVCR